LTSLCTPHRQWPSSNPFDLLSIPTCTRPVTPYSRTSPMNLITARAREDWPLRKLYYMIWSICY